jgi:hypothetical protein
MTPTPSAASKSVEGNMKPVTLVATVVARKSAVQAVCLEALNMPSTTMIPVTMPIILRIT